MQTVTVASFKGGTAKTSTALHLASALSLFHKKKCLLIDSDHQATLSEILGFSADDLDALPAILREEKSVRGVIKNTSVKGLDIITANTYLDQIETTPPLSSDSYAHERLRNALKEVQDDYDFCFIDIPPSLGWLCRSAFYASNFYIIATVPEPSPILTIDRMAKFDEVINKNHTVNLLGVLFSFWDERGAINETMASAVESYFPGKIFDSKVRRDVEVSRAVMTQEPVFQAVKSSRAGDDYKALAKEFLKKIKNIKAADKEISCV